MAEEHDRGAPVLDSKRTATRYRILVEIAERQPAVSQREIGEAIGVTTQAVSDAVSELIDEGFVEKEGRGRYAVTKEGVDWMITQTEGLGRVVDHVREDVIGQVDVEAAVATAAIAEGDRVSLTMRDGLLHASPEEDGATSAVAVTTADAGEDVGVTDVEGVIEYEIGEVTAVSVPRVQDGGIDELDTSALTDLASEHALTAATGVESVVALDNAGIDPDVRFGTEAVIEEATMRGVDVLLVAVADDLAAHTDRLREQGVTYEVVDIS